MIRNKLWIAMIEFFPDILQKEQGKTP